MRAIEFRPALLVCIFCFASIAAGTAGGSIRKPPAYQYFRAGNAADVQARPAAGFALMGGGTDLDEAFRFLCDRAGGGDLVVLRATGDDAYNAYIQKLCRLNSVATIVIPNREAAEDPFVAQVIRQASALFISGGDQANYINFWKDTPVEDALNDSIRKRVPMGGTSAGLAVLGQYVYTAQNDGPDDPNLDSRMAMADPFGARVTLSRDFLEIPVLKNVITDTHFARRDRMGRLLVFLARLNAAESKGASAKIRGIGVEQGAAVLLEPDGKAKVVGNGSAYFIDCPNARGEVTNGEPLTSGACNVQKVAPGHSFDIATWRGDATRYQLSVVAGKIRSTQASGAIY